MNGSSTARQLAEGRDSRDPQAFLGTHRALAACSREVARVSGEVVGGAVSLHAAGIADKPVTRQSPGRCIVQLGPVALTITWLMSGRRFAGRSARRSHA